MYVLGSIINAVLWLFMLFLIARMLLSWAPLFAPQWRPHGIVLVLAEAVYTVTDPPLRLFRKVLPPVRVGQVSLDLAFIGLWLATSVAQSLNRSFLLTP